MSEKTKKILKIAAFIAVAAAFIVLTVILTPKLLALRDASVREALKKRIDMLGVPGVSIMFILQVLQVVVALLPGEPVELFMGFLYGTFGGLAICEAGIAAGTVLVFGAARLFGKNYIKKISEAAKYKKLAFLRDPVRLEAMLFILFLIPGAPKDILIYFAPLTGIGPARFIAISCVARIPSIISSTYVGANLSEGNFALSAAVFAATALLGLAGIYINSRIMAKQNEKGSEKL